MQDLDIRGAGNLLGAEQSGFIADLGYEAYQKILKESVLELKTEEFAEEFDELTAGKTEEFVADCTIESDLELRLPADYVPQESERISLYQQLDNIETPEQIELFPHQPARPFRHDTPHFGGADKGGTTENGGTPARRGASGSERGKMRMYFVGDDNKAYYQSPAFGKVLAYLRTNPLRCELRDVNGKRSILIDKISTVSEALDILFMEQSKPA